MLDQEKERERFDAWWGEDDGFAPDYELAQKAWLARAALDGTQGMGESPLQHTKLIANLVSIADAGKRADGSDSPLSATLREAASALSVYSVPPPPAAEEIKPAAQAGAVVADWIEAVVQKAEVEWSYREDAHRYPRDHWHARCVLGNATWTVYGEQEEFNLPQDVRLEAERELRDDLRRVLSAVDPLSAAPAAEVLGASAEPKGCPTPGACSCPPPSDTAAAFRRGAEAMRQACHATALVCAQPEMADLIVRLALPSGEAE